MNTLRNFLWFQRTRVRNSFVTCKIHRNSVVWTDCSLVLAVKNSVMNARKEFGFPCTGLGLALAGFSEAEGSSLIYCSFVRFIKSKSDPWQLLGSHNLELGLWEYMLLSWTPSRIWPHPQAKKHRIPDPARREDIPEVPRMAYVPSPIL